MTLNTSITDVKACANGKERLFYDAVCWSKFMEINVLYYVKKDGQRDRRMDEWTDRRTERG